MVLVARKKTTVVDGRRAGDRGLTKAFGTDKGSDVTAVVNLFQSRE